MGVDFEKQSINKLTGKAKCTYNKLLSTGVSNSQSDLLGSCLLSYGLV